MREHKILRWFLCIIALIFVVHQIYSAAYKPITTISAEFSQMVDGLDITGVIIRQEKIITNSKSGALHFVAENGERVAKDGVIANLYSSADTSVTVSRIAELERQISDIEEIQGYNDVHSADLSLANNKVDNALNELIRSCAAGDFSRAANESSQLLTTLSRRQMITGEQTDFSARLEALKGELQNLTSSLPATIGHITAETSGYFVSGCDGYETVLSGDDTQSITPEFLEGIKAAEVPANAIGKIVSNYDWYIAATVSINDSLQYKVGDSLTIKTAIKSSPELYVTVSAINISEAGDNAAIVFTCQQMNSELASMRTGKMTIVKNTYSGLKLPKKSLRVSEGKTGVYVVSGISLKFVTVNVIYNTDDYIICEQLTSNDDVLRLYDEVVVKGRRLYDGKIID